MDYPLLSRGGFKSTHSFHPTPALADMSILFIAGEVFLPNPRHRAVPPAATVSRPLIGTGIHSTDNRFKSAYQGIMELPPLQGA